MSLYVQPMVYYNKIALAEEQAMEAEALESIFVDDFEQLSSSPYHWKLRLLPFPAEDEENHLICSLEIKIPNTYPNVSPDISITSLKGLTDDQVEVLNDLAMKSSQDNIGMAMIYTIAEEVKEWLLAHNEPPQVYICTIFNMYRNICLMFHLFSYLFILFYSLSLFGFTLFFNAFFFFLFFL